MLSPLLAQPQTALVYASSAQIPRKEACHVKGQLNVHKISKSSSSVGVGSELFGSELMRKRMGSCSHGNARDNVKQQTGSNEKGR